MYVAIETDGRCRILKTALYADVDAACDAYNIISKTHRDIALTDSYLLCNGGNFVSIRPLSDSSDPGSLCASLRAHWENIYRESYGIDADFSNVVIPTKLPGWRFIGIAKGLTINHAAGVYSKTLIAHDPAWGLWKYRQELDAVVTKNSRTSSESYFVCVRDATEPDAEYLGQSALHADSDQQIGGTLLERLVHGRTHLIETGEHLDSAGPTLCSGSRLSDGRVPRVGCNPAMRRVIVSCDSLTCRYPRGGIRRVVCA